jgi:hypothetical protein
MNEEQKIPADKSGLSQLGDELLSSGKLALNDFLLSCPVLDDEIDLERQKDVPRSIAL